MSIPAPHTRSVETVSKIGSLLIVIGLILMCSAYVLLELLALYEQYYFWQIILQH